MAPVRCPGPVNRREFLRIGSLALGGATLSDISAGRAAAGTLSSDTSVILCYLHGGPSQLETYDLKPHAPVETRSVFSPISTSVPGMDICEHFPLQAKIADKFSIVRSLNHDVGIHSDGGIIVCTGKRPAVLDPTSQSKSEHPDIGSIVSRVRGGHRSGMPQYVATPSAFYFTRPTYLGVAQQPFVVGNPASKNYAPPELKIAPQLQERGLDDRKALLAQFDRFRSDLDLNEALVGTDDFRHRAFNMLTTPQVAEAFDINQEPDKLRDRYGRNMWGQSFLLARRLAEAGTGVVSLMMNSPKSGEEFTNWDDHPGNAGRPGHFATFMRTRLPYLDQALTTMIEDIWDRGLNRRIMVVVVGEFGRTPRIRKGAPNDSVGRDHWPNAYSALISGGDLQMGRVIGATDSKAAYPVESPHSPQDLLATVYRHLGVDYTQQFVDYGGRPISILPFGEPIAGLL